jgi:hypothetical protein
MPAILTTTTIVGSAANASRLVKLVAAATAEAPSSLIVSRLFMNVLPSRRFPRAATWFFACDESANRTVS